MKQSFNIESLRNLLDGWYCVGDVISLAEYDEVLKEVREKFGEDAESYVMDCFSPEGEPIDPGYEDSLSLYRYEGFDE